MFYIDEFEALHILRKELNDKGIHLLEKINDGNKNIQITCPKHADGRERNPSCGVLKSGDLQNVKNTVHCFTCGYVDTFEGLISNCLGFDDNGKRGREWITNRFILNSKEFRYKLNIDFSRTKKKIEYIQEQELEKYRIFHPYMKQRGLTPDIIKMFDVGYDKDFMFNGKTIPCLTFPNKNIKGDVLFIARRSVKNKFFNIPPNVEKIVYGKYELKLFGQSNEVILCESIINALTCWKYGREALALNGTGTTPQIEELRRIKTRKIILALDNDIAGAKACIEISKALRFDKQISFYKIPVNKDLNDLDEDEFKKLKEIRLF